MALTIESSGRRHYLCGDTYAIRDKIKAAGFKWDPDRKCWWTGQREKAEAFLPKAERASAEKKESVDEFRTEMDRRRAEGLTLPGTACKADEAKRHGGVWDRRLEQWLFPDRASMQGCRDASAKRRGTKSPTKSDGRGRPGEVPFVGEQSDVQTDRVEPTARGYKPDVDSLIGQTRFIKTREGSVPMTTIGAEAYYLRGDDAEDNQDFRGSGWRIIEHLRRATDEDAAPVIATRRARDEEASAKKQAVELRAAQWQRAVDDATRDLYRLPGQRQPLREIAHSEDGKHRLYEVDGGVMTTHSSYDDYRSYLFLDKPSAIAELDRQIVELKITDEGARSFLAEYEGCEGTELRRRRLGLEPWAHSSTCPIP